MFDRIFGGGNRNQQNQKCETKDLATINTGYRLASKYEVVKKLGEGGFGAAFLVKSLTANVTVYYVAKAQKLTNNPEQNEELITRFKRESNTLQKLGNAHGQIPSLFDFFEFDGNFYLIQEYIKGKTLSDVLIAKVHNKKVFSSEEIIDITLSLLEVLIKVHEQNVIHRDIKPQNIILREGDNKPVLIDFGLIKEISYSTLDQTGTQAGTMGYCPLEQMCGRATYQSDLFAVGMTMLVCLTGIGAQAFKIEPNPIVDPQNAKVILNGLENIVEDDLVDFIQESLAVLPQNRFASAQEMYNVLLQIKNHSESINEIEKLREKIDKLQEKLDERSNTVNSDKTSGVPIVTLDPQTFTSSSSNKESSTKKTERDYTKYTLDNGVKKYAKNRLVLAVVTEYMKRNPQTTFTELKKIFPDNILGNKLGVLQKLSTVPEKEKKRYFIKEEEIILDANKEKIVVCNGWTVDNLPIFIDKARTLGFVINIASP